MSLTRYSSSMPSRASYVIAAILAAASLPVLISLVRPSGDRSIVALLIVVFGPFGVFLMLAGALHRRVFVFEADCNQLSIQDRILFLNWRTPRIVPMTLTSGWQFVRASDEGTGGTVVIEIAEHETLEVSGCAFGGIGRSGLKEIEQLIRSAELLLLEIKPTVFRYRLGFSRLGGTPVAAIREKFLNFPIGSDRSAR